MISELLTLSEFHAVTRANEHVVIQFFAKWSPPCRMVYPAFAQLATRNPALACFRVDVDVSPEISRAAKIRGMPTFVFYKRGESVNILEGGDEAELVRKTGELTFRSN